MKHICTEYLTPLQQTNVTFCYHMMYSVYYIVYFSVLYHDLEVIVYLRHINELSCYTAAAAAATTTTATTTTTTDHVLFHFIFLLCTYCTILW